MNTFLNIHGFGSRGNNSKAQALADAYPQHGLISPDLPAPPQESLAILDEIVRRNKNRQLIVQGCSMGGLYGLVMHIRYGIPALLINPALNPATLIGDRVGEIYEFSNGYQIVIEQEHADQFALVEDEIAKGIKDKKINKGEVLALIGEEDELLDQKLMKKILTGAGVEIISYNTDHRFTGFEEVIIDNQQVRDFLLRSRS